METLFTVTGTVVHGKGEGHRHGMPTANIEPDSGPQGGFIYPPYGVYGGRITIGDDPRTYIALVNVGTRPSDDDDPTPTIEALIKDFDADIYGERVTLTLCRYIREIRRFAGGLDEVRAQIATDMENYMKVLP